MAIFLILFKSFNYLIDMQESGVNVVSTFNFGSKISENILVCPGNYLNWRSRSDNINLVSVLSYK